MEIDTKDEIVSNPPNSPEPDLQENTFEWLPAEEKQIKVKKKHNKVLGKKRLDKTKGKTKQKYLSNSTDSLNDCNDSLEVKLEFDDNETSTIDNLNETKHETDELKQEEPPNIPFYKSKSSIPLIISRNILNRFHFHDETDFRQFEMKCLAHQSFVCIRAYRSCISRLFFTNI